MVLYCAYAHREGISGVKALQMFREAGGTIADSVFYDSWNLAGRISRAFGMDGVTSCAHVAAEETP